MLTAICDIYSPNLNPPNLIHLSACECKLNQTEKLELSIQILDCKVGFGWFRGLNDENGLNMNPTRPGFTGTCSCWVVGGIGYCHLLKPFSVVHDFQSEENYLILELRNEVACFVSSTTCADRVLSFD